MAAKKRSAKKRSPRARGTGRVRGGARAATSTSESAPSLEGSSSSDAGSNGAPSKAEFVRSLPPGTSYADAAEKAKAYGIELSRAYFYVLKSELKKKRGGGAGRGKPGRKARTVAGRSPGLQLTSTDPGEKALLDAVRRMGVARARDLVAAIERFEGP